MAYLRLPDLMNTDPFNDAFRSLMRPLRWDMAEAAAAPEIRLDVTENDGLYTIKADIPGVRKEDIDIRIDGPVVSLSAEVKKEKEEKEGERVLRSERSYGWASRSFTLGSDVDQDRAEAKYDNGVLELTLPKKASAEAKRLSIR
jgi:HSP20 family protein